MAHDIVIRGGEVADGTGADPVRADLAIDGGTITDVGDDVGSGDREIDAEGHLVTPGFVDIHTHLDAQVGWDPLLTPVSWHGTTTALLGNCGVTFAPCKPEDRDLLAGMMETVEDIPKEAILGGLPWNWEGYGEYLDALETLDPSINLAGMVGHCAVRFYVMGERAVEDPATDDEIATMARIVGQSIDDGAVGFSTNRFPSHVLPDGRSIPGTFAEHDEVLAITSEVGERDALMQNVVDFGADQLDNVTLLKALGDRGTGRVLFSFGTGPGPDGGKGSAKLLDHIRGDNDVTALSIPRGSGFVFGLQSSLPAWNIWGQKHFFGPTWERLADLDFAARVAAIADEEFCDLLVAEAKQHEVAKIYWLDVSYWMGAGPSPIYTAAPGDNLGQLAADAGEHWSETFLRLSRETDGRGLFTWRMYNQDLDALADLLGHEGVIPGLSDAGAHVSQVMDCGVASFILGYWARDRGLYSIGEAVRRLTSASARVIGLSDRGVLAPGRRADVNVIDLARLGEGYPELVHDFPGGAPRYIQRASGYAATLVNGTVSVVDGEHTGVRAGEIIRHRR